MKRFISLSILLLLFFACTGSGGKTQNSDNNTQATSQFALPEVPQYLTDPESRAVYLLKHWWSSVNLTDTSLLTNSLEALEAHFTSFLTVAMSQSVDKVAAEIALPLSLSQSAPKVQTWFATMYEKYLFNANSPMHNTLYFIPVVEYAIGLPDLDYATKVRWTELLPLIRRNNVGSMATDFVMTMAQGGATKRLTQIVGEHTLLFFYTPGCHSCAANIDIIEEHLPSFESLHKQGKMTLLFVYIDGDKQAWLDYMPNLPSYALVGMEQGAILKEQLYDLQVSPTLFLLDRDKKVLLKDTNLADIASYLQGVYGDVVLNR